jgi:hypothetical protein
MNYDALINFWRSQGLSTAGGATEEQIQSFERQYQLRVCREFRTYLSIVNGILETDNCDSNIFSFWPLSRLKQVREECPDIEGAKGHESYFVFADYMIWSWAYAINLDSVHLKAGEVVLLGGNRQQRIAESFEEFIRLYIEDSRYIYAVPLA